MAVYQQGEYWYVDFIWCEGATKRRVRRLAKDEKQRPVRSKTAAEAAELRIRTKLASGTFEVGGAPPEDGLTLAAFWPRYTREHVARNEPSSRSAAETIWRKSLKPVLGVDRKEVLLREVGAEHYAKIAARMREAGRKPKTINNALSALRTALDIAHEWGLRGPVVPVKWEKVPDPVIEFFDEADVTKLVAVGDPMVTFALKTGLRLGELLALRWSAVDLRGARVTVSRSVWWRKGKAHEKHTKSGRIRVIPLPPSALEALERQKKVSGEHEHVFVNEFGGGLTNGETKWPLWRVCDAAGVGRCRWHKLRHSYVTALVAKGVPLPQVQKLAGHARIEMTMRYTHVHADHLREAVSVLD
jgi:integrase